MTFEKIFLLALVPALFALEFAYFCIARHLGIVDKPNVRSSHAGAILCGGVIFPIAIAIWTFVFGLQGALPYPWFFLGLALISVISFVDDIHALAPRFRIVFQLIAMFLLVFQSGQIAELPLTTWLLLIVPTLILCTGIINAYNFMDGINGITGGYSLVVLAALWCVNMQAPFIAPSLLATAILATLVFVFFNFRKKARCFAGDVGSVSIAFIVLFVLWTLIFKTGNLWYMIFLAVYGIDSVFTILHRIKLREKISEAHRKHVYQLMANELKIPHVAVSLTYMALQGAICAGAILLPQNNTQAWIYAGTVLAILAAGYIAFKLKFYHLHKEHLSRTRTARRILLSAPHLSGMEKRFLNETLESGWIAPAGENLAAFEGKVTGTLGVPGMFGVAVNSGTAAIHLALRQLGIGQGDEVICQAFTFIASVSPAIYLGAKPVFVDSEADTWNLSPKFLEIALKARLEATGKLPKAIVLVHLYGMPAKIDEILEVANRYGVPVVEDAAEALGATYKGRACGTFGAFAAFSFNGNKIITTSAGGLVICKSAEDQAEILNLATQARANRPYYYHEKIGYNYRMSNVCAGIGLGQICVLDKHIARRRSIQKLYTKLLAGTPGISVKQNPSNDFDSNFWLTCILVDEKIAGTTANALRVALDAENIESRRLWNPMQLQPVFADCAFYGDGTSENLFSRGLCLPSGSSLSDADIERVATLIKSQILRDGKN